jgi:hypothetical protein
MEAWVYGWLQQPTAVLLNEERQQQSIIYGYPSDFELAGSFSGGAFNNSFEQCVTGAFNAR